MINNNTLNSTLSQLFNVDVNVYSILNHSCAAAENVNYDRLVQDSIPR